MKPTSFEGLVDAHAHLDQVPDTAQALHEARRVGISQVIAVGMARDSNQTTLALAEQFSGRVLPAIGYHPWSIRADELEATLTHIRNDLGRCIALGEVGLDYKVKVDKKLQQDVFAQLLSLAVEFDKPVIVHCRFSHRRALDMTRAAGVRRAVFHWYSGPLDIMEELLSDGYFISVTPALAYSPPHREAAHKAPLAQILVETDTPVSYQGRASQPADLLQTISGLSTIKRMPQEEVASITAQNARVFYGICPGSDF
jgi:TatD DNase family protein